MANCKCNKSFSRNYMLLIPEKASVFDLIRFLLISSNVDKTKFVDCPEGELLPFRRRWLIFLSIMAQKFLQLVAKPLASFGSALEQWLNLLARNRNIFVLFHNFIGGKVVSIPDKTSSDYTSLIGYLDKRRMLDENINYGDSRYYAALSIMAAKTSYENSAFIENIVKDYWKMDFLGFYDFWNEYQEKATTQAFLFRQNTNSDSELIVVAFRGTETFDADAWSTDVDLSWYELPGVGKVHGGFMKALGLQKNVGWPKNIDNKPNVAYYAIREMLRELLQKNQKAKVIVTGHSLGGALAILFPAVLAFHQETWLLKRLDGIYTYGQPRVGDEQFGEFMKAQITKHNIPYYRMVYCNDLVPRVPYDDTTFMFKHFGTCLYFDSLYKGKIVDEEPNRNYFSLLWIIPMVMNAIWELIRSFVIGFAMGREYKEVGVTRLIRFMSLMIAGVPVHFPQDYVNATRLGSPELYLHGSTNGKTKNN
ncbi:hypothetical protein ACH5RR_011440 [Cinchona calisaya]|uniref:Fungal lipase-type domain-containing protein n=1 Tax=Cinchona calisaya TaxID=153742 RepID=A0ABD3A4W3_9GENT